MLSDEELLSLCVEATASWRTGPVTVRVRHARSTEFSGVCYYTKRRIHVNLGRHLVFPYRMKTNLAKARPGPRGCWYRPLWTLDLRNGYELFLFVFLHELYHLLVRIARRNPRQKEGMCDRFAARYMVDRFGVVVRDADGRPVDRNDWDFQDLEGFVQRARRQPVRRAARQAVVSSAVASGFGGNAPDVGPLQQLWLFQA
jgi:hypothetical protein